MQRRHFPTASILILAVVAVASSAAGREPEPRSEPRILSLPWLIIDRNSCRDAGGLRVGHPDAAAEAGRLSLSAQTALDAVMDRHKRSRMIPRAEWEPLWAKSSAEKLLRSREACTACGSSEDLMGYDPTAIGRLASSLQADYALIGVAIVPLVFETPVKQEKHPCPEAEASVREPYLIRGLLRMIRAEDGATVWQGETRWPHSRRSPHSTTIKVGPRFGGGLGRRRRTPAPPPTAFEAREKMVDAAVHALGHALRKDFPGSDKEAWDKNKEALSGSSRGPVP